MIQLNICPLCKSELIAEKYCNYDFYCRRNADNHFYGKRMSSNYQELTQIKIRLTENNGTKLFCMFNYSKNTIEVWSRRDDKIYDKVEKILINGTSTIDLSDIDKFKSKLKTYLLFG